METIKWIKKRDLFVLDRESLSDITDWARNIIRNHSELYDPEDIQKLLELLIKIEKCLLQYTKKENGTLRKKLFARGTRRNSI